MAIYYIEDENGTYFSEDGKRRFRRLRGREAYRFLRSPQAIGMRFFKADNDAETDEELYVEIPPSQIAKTRRIERREQYVDDCKVDSELTVISSSAPVGDEMEMGEELIADETIFVEEEVLHQLDLKTLREALQTLTTEERELIDALYSSDTPPTVRELGEKMGLHFTTVSKRKKAILKKLRTFFDF